MVMLRAWILGDGGEGGRGKGVTKRCNGVPEDDSRQGSRKDRQRRRTQVISRHDDAVLELDAYY